MSELYKKGIEASVKYLEQRGDFEILEIRYENFINIIAKDKDDTVHMINVTTNSRENFSLDEDYKELRRTYELEAYRWFIANYDDLIANFKVSMDNITVNVISDDQAFLRFHLDVFS